MAIGKNVRRGATGTVWRSANLRDRAAFIYFVLICVVSVLTILNRGVHAHFWIWVGAAQNLLAQTQLTGRVTVLEDFFKAWLYPPWTALFFAPFTVLPMKLGQTLYVLLSVVVLLTGVLRVLDTTSPNRESWLSGTAFFLMIFSSDIVSSVPVIRLELLTVGLCFWSLALSIEDRKPFWAGAFLGFASILKLQMIPSLGLAVVYFLLRRRRALGAYLGGVAAGAGILPMVYGTFFSPSYVRESLAIWSDNLRRGSELTWTHYQSLFAFLYTQLGWPETLASTTYISVLIGVALVIWLGLKIVATTPDAMRPRDSESLLLAFGLGGVFTVLFSPMSQGSGYILCAPLVLLAVRYRGAAIRRGEHRFWSATLWTYWCVSYLVFSDVVPKGVERFCQRAHSRPLGAFILFLGVLIAASPKWQNSTIPGARRK